MNAIEQEKRLSYIDGRERLEEKMNETICTEYAHAKINLSLDVTGRRADGYHEVCMVMQQLALCDEIRMRALEEGEIRLAVTDCRGASTGEGEAIPCDRSNLMYQAAEKMRLRYGIEAGVEMELVKRIPAAAGLAGGSSDAAAVLRGMNRLFGIGASLSDLQEIGVQIGADVPYCVAGGTMLAEGIGERLTKLPNAPGCCVLLVKPACGVSTGKVYGALDAHFEAARHPDTGAVRAALFAGDYASLAASLGNILEAVTCEMLPEIREIKEFLQNLGADGVLMSGSGPTVFALFQEEHALSEAYAACEALRAERGWSDVIRTAIL